MPRTNRVKSWSKNQAQLQDEAISRLQQAHCFRLSATLESQDKSTSYDKEKSRKHKCQLPKGWYVDQDTVSATSQKGDFWSNGNTMTLQEQEQLPKIRMPDNFAGIITGTSVWLHSVLISQKRQIRHLNVCLSWHTPLFTYLLATLSGNSSYKRL